MTKDLLEPVPFTFEREEDEPPCPDDDDYTCYKCGEPTGRGYDSGLCFDCTNDAIVEN